MRKNANATHQGDACKIRFGCTPKKKTISKVTSAQPHSLKEFKCDRTGVYHSLTQVMHLATTMPNNWQQLSMLKQQSIGDANSWRQRSMPKTPFHSDANIKYSNKMLPKQLSGSDAHYWRQRGMPKQPSIGDAQDQRIMPKQHSIVMHIIHGNTQNVEATL